MINKGVAYLAEFHEKAKLRDKAVERLIGTKDFIINAQSF